MHAAMGYRDGEMPAHSSRYFISGTRLLRAIRLNYFMPSVPSFSRATYIGSRCCARPAYRNGNENDKERERERERERESDERETQWPGRGDAEKTTNKDEGTKKKKEKKKKKNTGEPLDVLYLRLLHTHLL